MEAIGLGAGYPSTERGLCLYGNDIDEQQRVGKPDTMTVAFNKGDLLVGGFGSANGEGLSAAGRVSEVGLAALREHTAVI